MKKYPFLSLKTNNIPFEEELKKALCDVATSGWYLNGKNTAAFESNLASFNHVRHVTACSNGLDALRLIFRAYIEMGAMQPGDEVIVPANTYIASVLAVSDNGLIPVFVEPSEQTMNLDIDKIESAISSRTRAIMPVHLYGAACWSPKMNEISLKYGLKIVEDNAQAIGAEASCNGLWESNLTGGLGDAGAFSFYPTKNLGALGDAGAVATNDEELAKTVKAIANYGSDRRYHNLFKGLNCRMDETQAAVLLAKLRHLPEITDARRQRASLYDRNIANPLVRKPLFDKGAVWHQYVIRVHDRNDFRRFLSENGVETDIHYAVPPHLQPCYREYAGLRLPVTRRIADEVVSLPITEGTPLTDIEEIADIINSYKKNISTA